MKVLFQDKKQGEMKLVAENLDDIWHLYNIVEENDLVRMVTFRTDEQKDDMGRSKKSSKKRMKLGIRVEEVKFHQFSDRLRIRGIIEEGPQEHGSYHTFNVDPESMNPVTIIKEEWKSHQLERIKEAIRLRNQPLLTFVCMDDDTATVAILRQSGVQHIADVESKRSGKMYESQDEGGNEYYGELLSVVKNFKKPGTTLIVLGPGFAKDHFVKYGQDKEPEVFDKYVVHKTGHPGMNGVMEAIKSGVVKKITRENRVVYETEMVEKLLNEIKKNGLASFGEKEVEHALRNGAVERLLITDELTRSEKGEKFLKLAKENKSKFNIINTMHDAGEKLKNLGGVAGLLRFKI